MIKKIIIIFGVIVLVGIIIFSTGYFVPTYLKYGLSQKLAKTLGKSQTVGMVTANRASNQLNIAEALPTWSTSTVSQVIGKAYKIERLQDDGQPAHVEFTYNPADLKSGIPESALGLYKWHDNGKDKFWAPIKSQVDTKNHKIVADLTSFSVLAVKAPLAYYADQSLVNQLNKELQNLIKKTPKYACGIYIIVEEELLEFVDGELVDSYLRPESDMYDIRDCVRNPKSGIPTIDYTYLSEIEKTINKMYSKYVSYLIKPTIQWQLDEDESAQVSGTVTDQNGKPLAGVKIIAEKQRYEQLTKETVTDKNGQYKLNLHSGDYKITADPSKNSPNCSGASIRDEFYTFGKLPDDVDLQSKTNFGYRHEPWTKDIKCHCSEYYINDTYSYQTTLTVLGMKINSTETHTIKGKLIKPLPGGYGWEGIWEVNQTIKSVGKTTGKYSFGGVAMNMPTGTSDWEDHFQYKITLPLRLKSGSVIPVVVKRVDEGYVVSGHVSSGQTTIKTKKGSEAIVNSEINTESTADNIEIPFDAHILKVNGKEGVSFSVYPATNSEMPEVRIQRFK